MAESIINQKFGRLTIVRELPPVLRSYPPSNPNHKTRMVECRCDCGEAITIQLSKIMTGHTRSCGCFRNEMTSQRSRTHGEARKRSPEYTVWANIIQRCENSKVRNFNDYGGRGITVCERWRNSYEIFLQEVGRRPSPDHSIDRIDNNGNYEPGNVRWATASEQARNRRKRESIK